MTWQQLIDRRDVQDSQHLSLPVDYISGLNVSSLRIDVPKPTITNATGRMTQPHMVNQISNQDRHPSEHRSSRHDPRGAGGTYLQSSHTSLSRSNSDSRIVSAPIAIPRKSRLRSSSVLETHRLSVAASSPRTGSPASISRVKFDTPRACARPSRPCADHEHVRQSTGEVVEFIVEGKRTRVPNHRVVEPVRGVLKVLARDDNSSTEVTTNTSPEQRLNSYTLYNSYRPSPTVPPSPPPKESKVQRSYRERGRSSPTPRERGRSSPTPTPLQPEQNIYGYLENVVAQVWQDFPPLTGDEELRRAAAAHEQQSRALTWWSEDPRWSRDMRRFLKANVPTTLVDTASTALTFSIPSLGFETKDYRTSAASTHEDYGLLGWFSASILETAQTILHLLRVTSLPFAFHIVAAPLPNGTLARALLEGYGSLVLVNGHTQTDRAMLLSVRPPGYNEVIVDFARGSGEPWAMREGSANLLQAQIYDECLQNAVYHFVVTTTTHWVFGCFNEEYTSCTTSPVFEASSSSPNIMQAFVGWTLQAFDSRPVLRTEDTEPEPSVGDTRMRSKRTSSTGAVVSDNHISKSEKRESRDSGRDDCPDCRSQRSPPKLANKTVKSPYYAPSPPKRNMVPMVYPVEPPMYWYNGMWVPGYA